MHICFITHEYPKNGFPHGGVGSFVQTLGRSLACNGYQVSIVGMNYITKNENEMDAGVLIYRLKPSKFKGLTWLLNSFKINKKIKEIHAKSPIHIIETAELGLAFLAKINSIKYIIRLHGGHHFFAEAEKRDINKWKGFQEKRSFAKADAFIGVSNYVKTHTEKYLSYHKKPVEIISNPIALSKFYASDVIKRKPFSIIFAGTVCEKKGIRQLVQALPMVIEKFPEAHLHIYGRDWLFPDKSSYIEFLKKQTPEAILEKITFHGSISHDLLPEAYEKATVCVFPSHMETQGLVAPEAMAMEKAVIFTKLGPGPEIIENYKTGLLCNPIQPEDIASKILWVFENYHEADQMARNARSVAIKKFNPEIQLHANINFYKRL